METAPSSITMDERLKKMLEALGMEYQEMFALCDYLHLIANLDQLPSDVIDLLAWQWHVDFWDSTLPLKTKIQLVRNSIPWHRKKGTPAAVEEMVATVLGDAKVTEWFEYGGEPYYFRIETTDSIQDAKIYDRIIELVNATKNVRSWLEKITVYSEQYLNLYWGGGLIDGGKLTVYPAEMTDKKGNLKIYYGIPTYIRDVLIVRSKE